ncbi:MAG: crossover junction endodeoxyribonuclease RuvC [Limisphaerales bacterium]|jgi:crossover junction endodeoxyribonuclease RuvC
MNSPKPQLILGIDPGTSVTGYSLIQTKDKTLRLVASGVIQLHKFESHYVRLHQIYLRLNQLVSEYRPDELAIEAPFFGKNVQSMLKLGRAQGVAITVALSRGIPVYEYSPRKIKQAITGNGNASKEQVLKMLQQTLCINEMPQTLDESDAIATAVCHYYESGRIDFLAADKANNTFGKSSSGSKSASRKKTDWKKFLEQNPDRIVK